MDWNTLIGLAGVAFVPVTAALTALWLSERARARRAEALIHELAVAPAARGNRGGATELTTAVDAIAVEVERISEGQRFLARVLAERVPQESVGKERVPRSVTPH